MGPADRCAADQRKRPPAIFTHGEVGIAGHRAVKQFHSKCRPADPERTMGQHFGDFHAAAAQGLAHSGFHRQTPSTQAKRSAQPQIVFPALLGIDLLAIEIAVDPQDMRRHPQSAHAPDGFGPPRTPRADLLRCRHFHQHRSQRAAHHAFEIVFTAPTQQDTVVREADRRAPVEPAFDPAAPAPAGQRITGFSGQPNQIAAIVQRPGPVPGPPGWQVLDPHRQVGT